MEPTSANAIAVPIPASLARLIGDSRESEDLACSSEDDWVRSAAWAARWARSYRNIGTQRIYEAGIKSLAAYGAAISVAPLAMTRQDVEVWVRDLTENGNRDSAEMKPQSPSSVTRLMSTASSFFDYCIENDAVGGNGEALVKNPVSKRNRPRPPEDSSQPYLTPGQIKVLVTAADERGPDLAAVLALMLCCLRVSEAIAVRVEDLGESGGHQVVRVKRKGEKVQTVPVPPQEWARLMAAAGDRKSGILIRNERGEPTSRGAIASRIRTLAASAGVAGKVTPHTFRHAAITYALEQGAPLHIVQQWAGHATAQTTAIYWRQKQRLDDSPAYLVADGYYEGPDDPSVSRPGSRQ